jgi:hypothetical protein
MRWSALWRGSLWGLAWLVLPFSLSAQVEVAPRITLVTGADSGSDITLAAGLRVRTLGSAVTPYASLYLRGTSVTFDQGPPPSGVGAHAALGVHVQGGEPDKLRFHATAGVGLAAWRRSDWGEEFVAEFEAGLTVPASESVGILLALRLEQLQDRGRRTGGSAGVVVLVGR